MSKAAHADRREILSAWFVAALALAAIGFVSPLAALDAERGVIDAGLRRPAPHALPVADAMPLHYDSQDFAEWLQRHRGETPAGETDPDG